MTTSAAEPRPRRSGRNTSESSRICKLAPAVTGTAHRVLEQAGNRHRADPAGDGSHVRGDVERAGDDTADEGGLGPVHARVHRPGPLLDHARRDERGYADSRDED